MSRRRNRFPRVARAALLDAALLSLALAGCSRDAATSDTPGPGAPGKAAAYVPTPMAASAASAEAGTPAAGGNLPHAEAEPVASTASIPLERLPVAEFVTAGGGTARLPIEVLPRDEFSVGLSGRSALGERGMLFDYGAPGQEGPFWMKNTHFDLDIAFIDGEQRVVSIRTMRAEALDFVYSGAPYRFAIEAPAGWYAAHGVREGDVVRFLEPPG